MFHCFGFLAIAPAAMLLAVSFFVLFVAGKTEGKNLAAFGRITAIILWIAAGVVLMAGMGMVFCGGGHCGKYMKHQGMGMSRGMMGPWCPTKSMKMKDMPECPKMSGQKKMGAPQSADSQNK